MSNPTRTCWQPILATVVKGNELLILEKAKSVVLLGDTVCFKPEYLMSNNTCISKVRKSEHNKQKVVGDKALLLCDRSIFRTMMNLIAETMRSHTYFSEFRLLQCRTQ